MSTRYLSQINARPAARSIWDKYLENSLLEPIDSENNPRRVTYQNPSAEIGRKNYRQDIDDLYGTGEAMERYFQHVQNVPQREDYKAGWGGKLLGALQGFTTGLQEGASRGAAAAQGVVRRPYQSALENWQLQGEGLKAAADIETSRDAKRVAYFEMLRKGNRDEWEKAVAQRRAEALVTTADARTKAADAQREFNNIRDAYYKTQDANRKAELKIQGDKAKGQVEYWQGVIRERGKFIGAYKERTGAMGKTGAGRPREVVISPGAQRDAEIDAANAVINSSPEFAAIRPFVSMDPDMKTLKLDETGATQPQSRGKVGDYFMGPTPAAVPPELWKKFKDAYEIEKKRRLSETMILNQQSQNQGAEDLDRPDVDLDNPNDPFWSDDEDEEDDSFFGRY